MKGEDGIIVVIFAGQQRIEAAAGDRFLQRLEFLLDLVSQRIVAGLVGHFQQRGAVVVGRVQLPGVLNLILELRLTGQDGAAGRGVVPEIGRGRFLVDLGQLALGGRQIERSLDVFDLRPERLKTGIVFFSDHIGSVNVLRRRTRAFFFQ